ncbi:hypothetical protein J7E25_12255 [Agromyces sp. ISL-38]|uniref:hypothetical protein n=1 Tax=Agromyces sp. ISL-38 TaxID=2819107 RepID=UPI001BEC75DB|nr:hypothetical protein [Agromyces sp. ISL-38]MBT2499863.1 hypothetical protein [Agromyces sp. ISL-38]MBT2516002.1 hypothetical protein [Streptomyces sp. ISL-90]
MARLPMVLGTDDLPLAELCAARIDGELVAIDDGWSPIDEPDLPALRAAVVALRAPRALVIERLSAAWVYGGLHTPPAIAQFCVPHRSRIAVISDHRSIVREVTINEADIVDFGPSRCTTVARTAFDLLRDAALTDDASESVVATLFADRPGLADEVALRFDEARRMPHKLRALERLDRARRAGSVRQAQPSLTR